MVMTFVVLVHCNVVLPFTTPGSFYTSRTKTVSINPAIPHLPSVCYVISESNFFNLKLYKHRYCRGVPDTGHESKHPTLCTGKTYTRKLLINVHPLLISNECNVFPCTVFTNKNTVGPLVLPPLYSIL